MLFRDPSPFGKLFRASCCVSVLAPSFADPWVTLRTTARAIPIGSTPRCW